REEAEEREAGTQQELERERDKASDQAAALTTTVAELTQARAEARGAELSQHLSKIKHSRQPRAASFAVVALQFGSIAAALATVGFWTYQLIWSAPQPSAAVQQRLEEEVQRQTKTATELQTKLQAAQAELQRQARAVADADSKRKFAEAVQQRLRDEINRLTKA